MSSPHIPQPLDVAGTRGLDIRIQGNACIRDYLTYPRDFSGLVNNQQVAYKLGSCLFHKAHSRESTPNLGIYSHRTRLCFSTYSVLPEVYCTQKLLNTGSLTFWNEIHLPYFKDANISP